MDVRTNPQVSIMVGSPDPEGHPDPRFAYCVLEMKDGTWERVVVSEPEYLTEGHAWDAAFAWCQQHYPGFSTWSPPEVYGQVPG